ncbi:MAG: flagellar hook-associated protein FlgK [Gammaproteobacteria bacterium]
MSGTVTNGLTALMASQRALQTTSNNIANANTPGYVRQRVDFVELPGTPNGRFTIGAGVAISDITRVYDQYLTENLRSSASLEQRSVTYGSFTSRLDSILGNPDTGITTAIQRFFDQVEAVGRDPTSITQRQQLLLEGGNLASRFQQLQTQLDGLGNEIDGRLQNAASTVNNLADQIARVNEQISAAGASSAPSLLDQRDQLLKALGSQIDISTVNQKDGSVSVFVGSGQSLVLGGHAAKLTTIPDSLDGSRLQLAIDSGNSVQDISSRISGGVIGGLLAFRNDVLDTSRQSLGQLAAGLAAGFNAQHVQGVDLNGDLGGDFFGSTTPLVSAATTNSGSATVSASITDASGLAGRDYIARFDGTAWSVMDRRTGASVAATGAGTPASPLQFEGLSVSASAGLAAGDRFLIRPVAQATSDLRVILNSPDQIAAAAPLGSSASSSNLSQAAISRPVVADFDDPKLLTPAQIVFDSPTSYLVFTGSGADIIGPLPYSSGDDISFAGWTAQVSGTPQTGDRFFVSGAAPGSGDNTNVLALATVANQGFFTGGTQSLQNLGAGIVASVGSAANRANNDIKVQEALRQQAEIDLENVSGVNLDEEAANMLRYQQSYLAASKVISVADGLFQNLLQIVGR